MRLVTQMLFSERGQAMRFFPLVIAITLCASAAFCQSGTLVVQNVSSVAVTETYISPSSSSTWGPNLGGVPANSSVGFTVAGNDWYDLKVVFANTDEMEISPIWVGAGATVTEQVDIFAGGGGGGGGGDDESCSTGTHRGSLLALLALFAALVAGVRQATFRATS
jgi:hypothetical protein